MKMYVPRMHDWNAMTNDERRMAVLTKVCGWEYGKCLCNPDCEEEVWMPRNTPNGFVCHTGYDSDELPSILTSADAVLEYVGEAVKAKGFYWEYSTLRRQAWIFKHSIDDAYILLSVGNGDLAPALCEAAWRMVTENTKGEW